VGLLAVLILATIYIIGLAVALMAAVGAGFGRFLRVGNGTPGAAAQTVPINVINPMIALAKLQPLRPAQMAKPLTPSPLPAVPGVARTEAEPFFRRLARENPLIAEALIRDADPAPEPVVAPSRGRHALPDNADVQVQVSPVSNDHVSAVADLDVAA
jgi:hypothetical protein